VATGGESLKTDLRKKEEGFMLLRKIARGAASARFDRKGRKRKPADMANLFRIERMTRDKRLSTALQTSALALLLASPALADLTPEQAWGELGAEIGETGFTLSAGSLNLSSEELHVTAPSIEGRIADMPLKVVFEEMTLSESADGAVLVTLPPAQTLSVTLGDRDVETVLAHDSFSILLSGDPGDMSGKAAGRRLGLTLDRAIDAGEGSVDVDAEFAARDFEILWGEGEASGVEALLAEIMLKSGVVDGRTGEVMSIDWSMAGASLSAVPPTDGGSDGISLRLAYEGSRQFLANAGDPDPQGAGTYSARSGAGSAAFSLSPTRLAYESVSTGVSTRIEGFGVGAVAGSVGRLAMSSTLPLVPTGGVQDIALAFDMSDLSLDAETWAGIDPKILVDRSPASISVALSGNVTGSEGATSFNSDISTFPFTSLSLSLEEMSVSALGAEIYGSGAISIDGAEGSSSGLPSPYGAFDFSLSGITETLSSLLGAGLISEGDMTGANFMLGFLTTPSPDGASLLSNIEIKPDFSLWVNGQRLR
jgi:hypothetical protein